MTPKMTPNAKITGDFLFAAIAAMALELREPECPVVSTNPTTSWSASSGRDDLIVSECLRWSEPLVSAHKGGPCDPDLSYVSGGGKFDDCGGRKSDRSAARVAAG
jgi:hypothetical protein